LEALWRLDMKTMAMTDIAEITRDIVDFLFV